MQIVAALFIDEIDVRAVPGPSTRIDLGGVHAAHDQYVDMNRLGLVDGFSPSTRDAISGLSGPVDRIAAALASPDLVVV